MAAEKSANVVLSRAAAVSHHKQVTGRVGWSAGRASQCVRVRVTVGRPNSRVWVATTTSSAHVAAAGALGLLPALVAQALAPLLLSFALERGLAGGGGV